MRRFIIQSSLIVYEIDSASRCQGHDRRDSPVRRRQVMRTDPAIVSRPSIVDPHISS